MSSKTNFDSGLVTQEPLQEDDYDKSLEYRQIARFVLIAGLILFIAGIFVYILFFVD